MYKKEEVWQEILSDLVTKGVDPEVKVTNFEFSVFDTSDDMDSTCLEEI